MTVGTAALPQHRGGGRAVKNAGDVSVTPEKKWKQTHPPKTLQDCGFERQVPSWDSNRIRK